MQPVPFDEYPIHQTPLSLRYVGTSDRNFYDRCYFNAHDRTGDVWFITGLGVYPNLGVDRRVRDRPPRRPPARRPLLRRARRPVDRPRSVGPYRIEVQEPLQRIRLICDGDEHGLGFDLTWEGSFPAVMEQAQLLRNGPRAILDTSRFAQLGLVVGRAAGRRRRDRRRPRTAGSAAATGRGASGPSARPSRRDASPTSPARASGGSTCRWPSTTSPSS